MTNWQNYDEKYKKLVQKYQFDPQVICHNGLQFKNIIVSKTIKLVKKYKNVDNILKNLDKISAKLSKQIDEKRDKIIFFKDFFRLNYCAKFNFDMFENLNIKICPDLLEILNEPG
ncbi:hypothetical protein Q4497_03365 [Mesomycoplasma ovipneumoniae]|uniref:Uncharacterized protein n=1 Tax=Mesomycoplasma ovipneumoniae TaxID=29562 RepID=A0AAW6Q5H4_9BACT|nr:hypothetical protein [Mesomycoplasma ovipneumoniae]MDF9627946.1 hypothetical protein [Mesomycoplasma ovipneumoniae]MDO4157969.1 hypothetical protein [Mesomycoplasma ovipneumoniae]MDO4158126.1 hypothetical protein [Mesomycoplasma ovipneumoniae]MDO6822049.1 hypothetical protein [Mesomycoplasma ovipneumoniae]MDO6855710.1 hypothetical protein [Mesomycoplasma ovipneumoniae]